MALFADDRRWILAAALSAALGAAQAQEAQSQARAGAVADGVSSAVGIAAGVPVNPLLPILGLGMKAVTFKHAESLPEAERPRAYAMAAAGWQGSAAGNACAAVSVLSGGSFLPACVVVGVAWGYKTWKASERERLEAERCAALRASTRKSKVRCASTRKRVEKPVAPARPVLAAQDIATS
ncbi:MAG TPA: hypothetical protein VF522_15580 [Ramlibacter sp.]|uniref:hypothetical protein n=1 Tax=Ramlibacter sp. TaxID=1917967 RepID=UPI002ED24FF6